MFFSLLLLFSTFLFPYFLFIYLFLFLFFFTFLNSFFFLYETFQLFSTFFFQNKLTLFIFLFVFFFFKKKTFFKKNKFVVRFQPCDRTRESHLVWTSSHTRSQAQTRLDRRRTDRTHRVGVLAPDAILLFRHRRAHWWVPARTPTVHQCPHSGKAEGGPQQATRDTTNTTRPRLQCHAFVTNMVAELVRLRPQICETPTGCLATKLSTVRRRSTVGQRMWSAL